MRSLPETCLTLLKRMRLSLVMSFAEPLCCHIDKSAVHATRIREIRVLWHAGGLTENDFVMASKINLLDFTDLQQIKKARTYFF